MKKFFNTLIAFVGLALIVVSCAKDRTTLDSEIPQEVINKIAQMGFNPDGAEMVEEGYRVERDIILTYKNLEEVSDDHRVPNLEQYRTTNVVNTGGGRTISIYIPVGGRKGFSSTYSAAVDEVIARYNAEGLDLTFDRATRRNRADIVLSRLSSRDEQRGVLGSAGFPTGGDPYGTIKMSGILESTYDLSVNGIATIIAHEVGHCIGFRHTDYFNRSISCNSGGNEGSAGVGAIQIPGTPSGATLNAQSFMLSCTDGSDRPFNNDDQTALGWMYIGNF